jgi:hypothetical protein
MTKKKLEKIIEGIIAEKADGLCMDVPSERRKMARLVVRALVLQNEI